MQPQHDLTGSWAGHYLHADQRHELFVTITKAWGDGKHWDGQVETRADGIRRASFHETEDGDVLGNQRDHDGVVCYRIQRDGDDLVGTRMVIGNRGGKSAMLRQPLRVSRANSKAANPPGIAVPDHMDPASLEPRDDAPEPGTAPFEPIVVERIVHASGTWTGRYS